MPKAKRSRATGYIKMPRSGSRQSHFPIQTLIDYVNAHWMDIGRDQVCNPGGTVYDPVNAMPSIGWPEFLGVSQASWQRGKKRGYLSTYQADAIATHNGVHPSRIWGDLWWDTAASECSPRDSDTDYPPARTGS